MHRVRSDEQFSHIDGGSMTVHMFDENTKSYKSQVIGKDEGADPYLLIPQGVWFAYTVNPKNSYSLLTCTLSPAFDLNDFQMATVEDKIRLQEAFPAESAILESFVQRGSNVGLKL